MRELPKISAAMLTLTHECNLRCRYCFVRKGAENMSLATAKAAAGFLRRNALASGCTPEINFFGGEPMLRYEEVIRPLVEWAHTERGWALRFSITTNGTLLTPERIGFMKRHGFSLLLSMDGIREVQDFNRPDAAGRGSFGAAGPIAPLVAAAWPGAALRMTAIPASCGALFRSIRWAEAQGFGSFFVIPDVFQPWDAGSWETLAGEIRKYADYVLDKRRKRGKYIKFSAFEQAGRDMGAIALAKARGERRSLPGCRAAGKCGLGAGRFAAIAPDGALYACQELCSYGGGPFLIGSVFTGADEARRRALMALYDSAPARGGGCEGCAYDPVCDGGCAASNFLVTGAVNRVPETYCRWKRLLLAEAERIKGKEAEG